MDSVPTHIPCDGLKLSLSPLSFKESKNKSLLISVLFALIGCQSSGPGVTEKEAKAAQLNNASMVTAVEFKPGTAELTAGAKDRLNSAIDKAKAAGQIDAFKVITGKDALGSERRQTLNSYLKERAAGVKVVASNAADVSENSTKAVVMVILNKRKGAE
jgi:hypothetical protein